MKTKNQILAKTFLVFILNLRQFFSQVRRAQKINRLKKVAVFLKYTGQRG